ncbi:hypothetical protein RIF29_33475 [Crotalaria pallida]|uniref:Uncharacterized protein n=1 Tax=Crotalaria pallida TaxID=3830 RepID=A0AAN9E7U6_CROPI
MQIQLSFMEIITMILLGQAADSTPRMTIMVLIMLEVHIHHFMGVITHMGMDTTISVKNVSVDLVGWTSSIISMQLEHDILKSHVSFIHLSRTIPSVPYIYILAHRCYRLSDLMRVG